MSEKKVGKRLLTWVLVLVMTLSLLPLNVLAASPAVMRIVSPDTDKYITYEFYNGEAKVDEQIIKTGDTLLEPEIDTQEGKRLKGWYTENDTLFDGFGEYTETIEKNSTVKLYAKFEDVYYVYFKDTTTGRIVATKEGVTGAEIKFDDVSFPVESDESITGWYLESDSNKTAVTSVTLESTNVTLCAIVEKGHWITFDSKGGSNVAPQFVRSGDSCAAPSAPTKPGYDFVGWYTDEETNNEFEFGSTLSDSPTLYAKWAPSNRVSYTVIHWLENADNDKHSFKASESKIGTAGNQTAASAKSYDGFTAQAITQQTINGDGSTIVNVYYKRNVYTITFYLDNPIYTCGKEAHTHSGWDALGGCYNRKGKLTCTKEAHTHNSSCKTSTLTITAKYGANISKQWPTVNGSNTWRTTKNGSTSQVNIDTMPLGGATFYGPKTGYGSETAYYYVEVLPGESGTNHNGTTYKLHHSDTSPGTGYSVSEEDKYSITGFTYKEGTPNGYAYNNAKFFYTRNSYSIVYVNSGAEDDKTTVSYKFEAPISNARNYKPTTTPAGKDGYVFAGWYADPAGEQPYDFANKTMPAQNITVYARWKAPTFTVRVYDVDKETELKTFENVPLRRTISMDAMPTGDVTLAEGDTFLGWTYKDGTPFNFNTAITQDIELYARVGNKTGYSVTYNYKNGSNLVTDPSKYAKGAFATVFDGPDTAPANQVFLGWTTKNDGSKKVEYYPNSSIEITGNVTLYAVYGDKAETVTVTYHSNFGSTDSTYTTKAMPNNGKFSVADYSALDLPDRTGYEFIGWSTKSGEQKVEFEKGDDARADTNGSNDLYAQWKSTQITDKITVTIKGNTSTVTYDGAEQEVTGYTVESSDKRYTVSDFTFSGTAVAKGTNAGTYPMNLTANQFKNTNTNFTNVEFVVTDGKLTINPVTDKVTVTIKGNTGSETYNGEEQSVTGYTVESISNNLYTSSDFSLKAGVVAEAKGTDANTTAYLMNLTSDSFANKSQNFSNVKFDVTDGSLTITKRNIVVTANDVTVPYDGKAHGGNGCTADNLVEGHNVTATITGSETNVGVYPDTLVPSNAKITDQSGTDVTNNYKVEYARGTLTITKRTETATVTITGNHNSVKYNGREQSVTGFTYTAPEGVTVTLNAGSKAEAKGTDKGTYYMGLTKDDFTVFSEIYKEVKIIVNDGYLEITRSGGHHPRPKPTVEIKDDDALGLNTTDHFAYIVGYGNGEVRPQNNITRAEVATIFFRLLTDDFRDENLTKTNRYSDVAATSWYNTAVSTLSSMGIITGYPDGTFRPNAAITRAEFAAIAARFDHDGDKTTAKFSDIANHWAKDEISIAYNNGWITGYPDGTFGPQRDITRAETMTLVNRVLNRQPETEDDLLPNMTVWTDNANPNVWYYLAVQEATNSHYYKFKTNSKYEKWTELRETRDWTQLEK